MDGVTISKGGAVTYSGLDATKLFAAKVIKTALRLYIKTGMKANRAYTPSNMIATINSMTGQKFKVSQKQEALEHLEDWIVETEKLVPFNDERIAAEA